MNWYTVILLYAEDFAGEYAESYSDWIRAESAAKAAELMKRQLARKLKRDGYFEEESLETLAASFETFGVLKGKLVFESLP